MRKYMLFMESQVCQTFERERERESTWRCKELVCAVVLERQRKKEKIIF